MFNIMRQMNTKIDKKSEYISEVLLFQFTKLTKNWQKFHKICELKKEDFRNIFTFLVYFCIHLSHNIEHKVNILANTRSSQTFY